MLKIVLLTKEQFDNFSYSHPLHTFYQTSAYADLMAKYSYNINYYGFINDSNNLIGATMMLSQKLIGNHKYAYCPRGFLINYDDKNLVMEVTSKFKKYLSKQKFVFLKIDPPVINNKRDKNGNIIQSAYTNDTIAFLQKIGYNYFGDNKFFGTLKPRWNALLKVTGSSETLFENLDRSVKNKIRKAQSRGIEIIQGTPNDIPVFFSFVEKKHYRKLDYYQNFAASFGDNFELYFAKLNSEVYLKNIKILYEEELAKNEQYNLEIQQASLNNNINPKITNSKITSDKLLAIYKKELITASELFEKNPNGIIIGAGAYIIQKYGVSMLIEGLNNNYKLYYPTFAIKWYVIDKYAKLGAVYFDLNAITGYFEDNNKFKGLNEMKLGFNADVTEYIGEFDLIINKNYYRIYHNTKFLNKVLRKQSK